MYNIIMVVIVLNIVLFLMMLNFLKIVEKLIEFGGMKNDVVKLFFGGF